MKFVIKHFEELTPSEVYDFIKLRLEVFVGEQGCSYEDLDDRDQVSYHLFLYEAGKIVAYCRILPKGVAYEEMSIGRVCVHKSYRSKHLGKAMMEQAIAFVKTNYPTESIKISAQSYIIPFYESLGFKVISDAYLEEGIEHKKMKWK